MTITINNQTIKLKKTIRAYIIFESITSKPFQIQDTKDIVLYFYSISLANGLEEVDLDEFINFLDDNEELLSNFIKWVSQGDGTEPLKNQTDQPQGEH